jgi:hypothetical protein
LGHVEFSYFDPTQEKYVTLKSKPLALQVEADGSDPGTLQVVGFGKEDVRFIGKDIRFIKTENISLRRNTLILFGSKLFVALNLIFVIAFFIVVFLISRSRKLSGNIALVRTRKANKIARKRLKEVHRFLVQDNSEMFHDELLRAMWGYVSDKLSIPLSSLSSESVKDTLLEHNVSENDVEEFIGIISTCEYARYAPKGMASQMADLYHKSLNLISTLEGVIKK